MTVDLSRLSSRASRSQNVGRSSRCPPTHPCTGSNSCSASRVSTGGCAGGGDLSELTVVERDRIAEFKEAAELMPDDPVSVRAGWRALTSRRDMPRASSSSIRRRSGSAAADSRCAGSAAGHEGPGERRGLLAVLLERGLKPDEGPVTLRQVDRVDRQVVHETGVVNCTSVGSSARPSPRWAGE